MENDPNIQPEQPQYSYPPQQQYDYSQQQYGYPQQQYNYPYPMQAPDFLPMAITALVLAEIPVASIVAIILGSKNKRRIQNYLAEGGQRTAKVKVSSILSTVGLWLGVGMTIFYAVYFFYLFAIFAVTMSEF